MLLGVGAALPATARADFVAELVARGFFRALLEGRPAAALPLCADEVSLEGRPARGKPALERALGAISDRARRGALRLTKLVVLPAAEASRRFGPPPARLQGALAPGRIVALARFGPSRGAVAVLARRAGLWRVIALTD